MKKFVFSAAVIIALFLFFVRLGTLNTPRAETANAPWWTVQSIDTMKYSRDMAAVKLNDSSFDTTINQQVAEIAGTGANYVAIATPYDEQFVPFLKRWVTAARKYGLKVWFRGNFSGWEKWFDYQPIDRSKHLELMRAFITNHSDLFSDGDIFTPCPECENGGPGDPRLTGDVVGFRLFLISEHRAADAAFAAIGKKVSTDYASMNRDVANLVMDKATTRAMGGIVGIDHYVETPEKLLSDIRGLAAQSGGKIFLGEFGVPIPDINGDMTGADQANWIKQALQLLVSEKEVVGVNYWVGTGGSTELWLDDGTALPAVAIIRSFFSSPFIHGTVVNDFDQPIANAEVFTLKKSVRSDSIGNFSLPVLSTDAVFMVRSDLYADRTIRIENNLQNVKIIMQNSFNNPLKSILAFIKNLFHLSP